MRDGRAFRGGGDVHERLDVVDDDADLKRDALGRDEPARDRVNEVVFVASRIVVAQQVNANGRALAGCLAGFYSALFLALDADDAFLGADGLHDQLDARNYLCRTTLHDDRVFMQQRLAFGTVGDDDVGFTGQFDVRREAAAARADHAGLFYLFNQAHKAPDATLKLAIFQR